MNELQFVFFLFLLFSDETIQITIKYSKVCKLTILIYL